MKKTILLILVALGAFYGHARLAFAEPRVMRWLMEHDAKVMSGDASGCDDYADDVRVSLSVPGQQGPAHVEGGKGEMCEYKEQAAAAMKLMRASTNTQVDQVEIARSGFPWTTARVTYSQTVRMQIPGVPGITVESDDEVVLVRTLSGIKIKSVESRSRNGL
jgi:hypothetical protein